MENIWVTGANGQLGSELKELSRNDHHWFFTDLPELDICDETACRDFIARHSIRTILHCAAYTAVDRAESEAETVFRVNTQATIQLARLAAEADAQFIFLSTDYVFDGMQTIPYTEADTCHPLSLYGRSKYEAEIGIRQSGTKGIILRTAWLYSRYGNNFVKTMLRLAQERSTISVVNDQIGTPTYARDLAQAICQILPQLKEHDFHGEIFHFSNEGICSWFDLASRTIEQAGLDCQVRPITSSEYPSAALRPPHSVLSKAKIKTTFGLTIPHWEVSLSQFLQEFLP